MSFIEHGILVDTGGPDEQRVICPECTPTRRKQNLKDLAVSISKETWFCHHCGWKGGLKNNNQVYVKKDMPAKIFKKPVELKSNAIPDSVLEYWQKRGIRPNTLQKAGVSFEKSWMPQTKQDENCVVFNYYIDGELINKKYRTGRKHHKMEKDARLVFYAPLAKNNHKYEGDIYITEGEPDCLTLIELGFDNVVSPPNGAPAENVDITNVDFSYMESFNEIVKSYKRVFLVMDVDKVGARFRDELARRIGYERCFKAEYPEGCKDINDVLVNKGEKAAQYVVENCVPYPIKGKFDVEDLYENLYNMWGSGFKPGNSTGWGNVDKYYTVREKEFTILTGIPGSGKSSWLDHLMVNLALYKQWGFAIFSPENFPFERHIAKLCEIKAGKPFDRHYNGHMDEDELIDSAQWCNDYFHFIMPDEDENQTIDNILNLARASIFKDGIKGLVIDPWNEIEHEIGRDSETVYISKVLTKIRKFCRINDIHCWIVAHPTKLNKRADGSYPIPTPYDIAGSAHFRNKADNCICVHRDYEDDKTDIHIQKVRFKEIGKVGQARMQFNVANGKYSEAEQVY